MAVRQQHGFPFRPNSVAKIVDSGEKLRRQAHVAARRGAEFLERRRFGNRSVFRAVDFVAQG
jgi:hypothetical protein